MKTNTSEILDAAIDQLRGKKPLSDIMQSQPDEADELLSLLQTAQALEHLTPVEMPSEAALQTDRKAFLEKIEQLETSTVSPGLLARIKGWNRPNIRWPQLNPPQVRKENWNMGALLAKAVLVISLLFGASGGAYAMAEQSLPDEPMYNAKLAMEQLRLNMVSDPAEVSAQHMVMAKNRVQEIIRLAQKGTPPDAGTMTRLENHLNLALQFAAQLENDEKMLGTLTQARLMVHEQQQEMNQFRLDQDGEPLQERIRETQRLLNQFQDQVEAGLGDPQSFRWQYQHGQQENVEPPGQPGGNPDCPQDECVPEGDKNQYGPQPEQPGPGQPGGNPDCTLNECEPVGDQNHYGPNADQPGPGQPGGNPDCQDCEPAGDQNQNGPKPDQPGPGQPGGNPDCTSGSCEPAGDQNGPKR